MAYDQLTSFVRTNLAPWLRSLGFVGSGQQYQLPDERFYALLGIQRARGNTADEVRFTINVNVVPKDEWDRHRMKQTMQEGHPWWPDKPKANVDYMPDWWVRIGTLIDGTDRWWTLTGDPDVVESVSVEVKEAIVRWAYPEILRRTRVREDSTM